MTDPAPTKRQRRPRGVVETKPRRKGGGAKPTVPGGLPYRLELRLAQSQGELLAQFAAEEDKTPQELIRSVLGEYVARRLIV